MLKVTIEIEESTFDEAQTAVEHVAEQIGRGFRSGAGFDVEGEEEDESEE